MKRTGLFAAAAIVVLANALALLHAWQNRSGPVDADVTLTERELSLPYRAGDEDSSVSLGLHWIQPEQWQLPEPQRRIPRFDAAMLRQVGFDTSVPPSDPRARDFYRRQRARPAFLALEYQGPAWRKHVEETANVSGHDHDSEPRLVFIDASGDREALRRRHPDRNMVIVLPAVVNIGLVDPPSSPGEASVPAQLFGWIRDIQYSIHVARPFSDSLRNLPHDRTKVSYRVHLRYGAALEPWVAGVEILQAKTP
jgi:hypothetical protein